MTHYFIVNPVPWGCRAAECAQVLDAIFKGAHVPSAELPVAISRPDESSEVSDILALEFASADALRGACLKLRSTCDWGRGREHMDARLSSKVPGRGRLPRQGRMVVHGCGRAARGALHDLGQKVPQPGEDIHPAPRREATQRLQRASGGGVVLCRRHPHHMG